VRLVLLHALAALEPRDRLLLKLRILDGMKVVDIAREFGEAARPLYRRIEQLLERLRREIEKECGADVVKTLFDLDSNDR
jgi:DNA-directed RNA polymerase specialized sigma24 family protein